MKCGSAAQNLKRSKYGALAHCYLRTKGRSRCIGRSKESGIRRRQTYRESSCSRLLKISFKGNWKRRSTRGEAFFLSTLKKRAVIDRAYNNPRFLFCRRGRHHHLAPFQIFLDRAVQAFRPRHSDQLKNICDVLAEE